VHRPEFRLHQRNVRAKLVEARSQLRAARMIARRAIGSAVRAHHEDAKDSPDNVAAACAFGFTRRLQLTQRSRDGERTHLFE